jgi:hypothetical protein
MDPIHPILAVSPNIPPVAPAPPTARVQREQREQRRQRDQRQPPPDGRREREGHEYYGDGDSDGFRDDTEGLAGPHIDVTA